MKLLAAAASAALVLLGTEPASAEVFDITFTGTTQGLFTEDPAKAPLGMFDYVASYWVDASTTPNFVPDGETGFYFQGNDGSGYASPIVSASFSFNGNTWTFPGSGNFGSAYDLSSAGPPPTRDTGADLEGDGLSLYNDFQTGGVGGSGQVNFPGNVPGEPFYAGLLTPTSASVSQVAAVPEPSTWAMMMMGLGGLGWALRRRRASMAVPC